MPQKNDLLANKRYLQAVSDMATRIDRILSGQQTVTVRTTDSGPSNVPAFQNGANLYLVPPKIRPMVADPDDEREVLPLLLALNMHEYGHFEYSACPTNAVWQREESRVGAGLWQAVFHWLNLCEDQRQELLVSTRFPRARHYFRLVTLRGMLMSQRKRGSIAPENFLLYYGRRHILPRPLLARLEAALVAKYSAEMVDEAKGLIDEFLRLPSTTDAALRRQWEIAETLNARFGQNAPADSRSCLTSSQIGARTSKASQEKQTKQAGEMLDKIDEKQKQNAERDRQKAEQDDEANDDNDDASLSKGRAKDEPEQADEPATSDSGESEDAGDELNDLEADDSETGADTSDDGEECESCGSTDPADTDGNCPTCGESRDEHSDDCEKDDASDKLEQELENYIDRADSLASSELAGRAEQIRAEILKGPAFKLANVLKSVATDLGMVDHARLKAGKLDIRRVPAAIASRETRVFRDRRQNLKREASMLVHILLDSSSSMDPNKQTALDATAIIARAADLADHRGKVTTFSSEGESAVLKDWAALELDRANVTWFGGGTDPGPVLDTVAEDFRKAQTAFKCFNRVLLVVTDGQFEDEPAQAERFTALKRAGVHTFLIGIGMTPGTYGGKAHYDLTTSRYTFEGGKKYDVDGALQITTVNDLEAAMRVMLRKLAVQIAHDVTARY